MKTNHYQIAREHPNLSPSQALVAQLGEALEMSRGLESNIQEILAVGEDKQQRDKLLATLGTTQEIQAAEKAIKAMAREIVSKVTLQDLAEGKKAMRITASDFEKAMMIRRELEKERNQSQKRNHNLGLER